MLIQLTGLSGAGKTTLGYLVKKAHGFKAEVIDGDEFRSHLCRDLSFSKNDRIENIRRLGFVSELLVKKRELRQYLLQSTLLNKQDQN